MKLSTFPSGGFVIHNLTFSCSVARFSVWYDADGNLLDCERINVLRRSSPVSPKSRVYAELQRAGRIYRRTA